MVGKRLCLWPTRAFFVSAQSELLSGTPETKEEFIESEPKVLATIDWLENFSGDITGVYKVDDKRYAKLDIERYGASVESKILLYYSRQK